MEKENYEEIEENEVEIAELDPQEYFDYLKSKVKEISNSELDEFYNGCLALVEKYKTTGQIKVLNKIKFLVDCVEKEKKLVEMGITKYVYRDDIEDYIDNISKDAVKIIEIENYPRDIPDEIVKVVAKTKDIFDRLYVVFTDYTGKVEKQVEAERRRKDPILFGTFQRAVSFRDGSQINDRFYYLGDWEDEYCDLTLDKFLREAGRDKLNTVEIPENKDEILAQLDSLVNDFRETSHNDNIVSFNTKPKNANIWHRLKRWIGIEE